MEETPLGKPLITNENLPELQEESAFKMKKHLSNFCCRELLPNWGNKRKKTGSANYDKYVIRVRSRISTMCAADMFVNESCTISSSSQAGTIVRT